MNEATKPETLTERADALRQEASDEVEAAERAVVDATAKLKAARVRRDQARATLRSLQPRKRRTASQVGADR